MQFFYGCHSEPEHLSVDEREEQQISEEEELQTGQ
jgi:hypothetical protein